MTRSATSNRFGPLRIRSKARTALGVALLDARVVMVCRNAYKGKAALEEIRGIRIFAG